MCGRYSLFVSLDDLVTFFNLPKQLGFNLRPRYNIAPGQDVPAIRIEDGQQNLVSLHWGLIPSWAKDPKIGYKTINARSEVAHKTPSFRTAFRTKRCLIPASGFFEWQKEGNGKQPYHFQRVDGNPMALAGLWESWLDQEDGRTVESCSILTINSNALVGRVHHRMPVILEPIDFDGWLDPRENRADQIAQFLRPATNDKLYLTKVSKLVNRADSEGPELVVPVKEQLHLM